MNASRAIADRDRARTAAIRVGVIAPAILTVLGTVLVAFLLPGMPETVAIQFSFDGQVSNTGPAWSFLVLAAGTGALFTVISAVQARKYEQSGSTGWSRNQRFTPALMLGAVAMVQALAVTSCVLQRGVTDLDELGRQGSAVLWCLLVWPVVTAIGYAVQPNVVLEDATQLRSDALPIAPGERVVWVGSAAMSAGARALLFGLIAVGAIGALVLAAVRLPGWWIAGLVTLILVLSALITFVYRVRIDAAGLTVSAPLGFPVFRVPTAEIGSVRVRQVDPFGEYGGWGLRSVPGAFGVVLRTGPALCVARTSGKEFVVTLDDAETAGRVLSAHVAAARNEG